jgi:hypothetical protein
MVEMCFGVETSQLAVDGLCNVGRMIWVFAVHLVMDWRTLFTVIDVQREVGCRWRMGCRFLVDFLVVERVGPMLFAPRNRNAVLTVVVNEVL